MARPALDVDFNLGGKIHRYRADRNLTLKDVAESTGFSKALLSRIEHSLVSPPIATLYRISKALNVKMSDFFAEEPVSGELRVTRAGDREKAYRDGSRYGYQYLSMALSPEAEGFEPLYVTLDPEHRKRQHLFHHPGQEFIYVVKGCMEFHYGKQKVTLKAGDSIIFSAQVPHAGVCAGRTPVEAISIRLGRK